MQRTGETTRTCRALVIGGGVVGCSVLHHLVREGWSDVALCERRELTAGATWHSSGHISAYTSDPKLVELAQYTRGLIDRLRTEVDQDLGLHAAGSLRLATRTAHLQEFQQFIDAAEAIGVDARLVSPRQARELWPLMNVEGVLGALHLPRDCYLNAADFTQALAKAARSRGAEILRQTEVVGLEQARSGGWLVRTTNGDIRCDHVVSATGIFARRTFALARMFLPVAILSHQYLVTGPVAEVIERRRTDDGARLPILRQPDIRLNVREEGDGLFISVYESNTRARFPGGPPMDYGMELLPPDFDSIEDRFAGAIHRVPCLGKAGIKEIVHGPLPWSPDFAPLIGPVPDRHNLWVAEGVSYGVTWSGGVARLLARWIVHGDPGCDTSVMDCRRFGALATPCWADERATRSYLGSYNSEFSEFDGEAASR